MFLIKKQVPSFQQTLRFVLAFAFWPLSPTRLKADGDVYNQMADGKARLADCVLYGVASLHPALFYTVRIATLVLFWVMTIKQRPHFIEFLLSSVIQAYGNGTLLQLPGFRKLFCVVLLFLGWLAIIGEAVLFLRHRKDFNLLHNAAKNQELVHAHYLHHFPTKVLRGPGAGSRLF